MAEEKEKSEKKKPEVELTEVVATTDIAFKLPDETIVNQNGLLVYIANKVDKLEKALI